MLNIIKKGVYFTLDLSKERLLKPGFDVHSNTLTCNLSYKNYKNCTSCWRLGNVLKKLGKNFPSFERCPASTPEQVSVVIMSKLSFQRDNKHFDPRF